MSAVGQVISALPLFQGTQHFGIAANPSLGLHEAAAFRAALGALNESRARLAGLVALVANYLGHFAVTNRLASSLNKSSRHPAHRRHLVSVASLILGNGLLGVYGRLRFDLGHEGIVPGLRPS